MLRLAAKAPSLRAPLSSNVRPLQLLQAKGRIASSASRIHPLRARSTKRAPASASTGSKCCSGPERSKRRKTGVFGKESLKPTSNVIFPLPAIGAVRGAEKSEVVACSSPRDSQRAQGAGRQAPGKASTHAKHRQNAA